mgnify:CR=1 FL=1
MDNDSTRNGGRLSFADRQPPLWRAQRGLQADLSLFEVALLTFPDPGTTAAATMAAKADRKDLLNLLLEAAFDGALPVYGKPDGWEFDKSQDGYPVCGGLDDAFPKVEGHEVPHIESPDKYNPYGPPYQKSIYRQKRHGGACLVSHTDYFAFLKTPLALGIPEPNWLAPAAESIPPVETSLPEPAAKHEKRQRNDALNHAIRAALAVLSPSGGALPRPHELFEHLAYCDATKTITGIAKGNRALHWIDDNGNEQTLTFPALTKRLDRIRQGD